MHAHEHEQAVEEPRAATTHDHHDWLRDQMRFGLGSIPPVTAAIGATGHAQTASEQAYEPGAQLAAIQGHAMFALLPELEKLPPSALDEARAGAVGGPRLQTAVRAVKAKRAGATMQRFADAYHDQLAALPSDQIDDIRAYYSAPKPAAATGAATGAATTATESMPAAAAIDAAITGLPIDAALVTTTFMAETFRAHPVLAARLRAAEDKLAADLNLSGAALAKALGIHPGHGMRCKRSGRNGWHFYALAIDLNYETNPWIGGQQGADMHAGNEDAMAAIWRACWLTGHGQAVSPGDTESRFKNKPGTTGELWEHMHDADLALREYLGAAAKPEQVEAWLAAKNLDRAVAPPKGVPTNALGGARLATANAAAWLAQIRDDLARTHGATATGSDWYMTGGGQRSDLGFMDLDRRLVIALREVGGLAWGASDFDGEGHSGDMQHFDCRHDYPEAVLKAADAAGKVNPP